MKKMKGSNLCAWITRIGEVEVCGKLCIVTYCKIHCKRTRAGMPIRHPYRKCGKGIQSAFPICEGCGAGSLRVWHFRKSKKARHQYNMVMEEFLRSRTPIQRQEFSGVYGQKIVMYTAMHGVRLQTEITELYTQAIAALTVVEVKSIFCRLERQFSLRELLRPAQVH